MDLLDRIIAIATKANAAVNVIAPGTGAIGTLGIGLVKFIAGEINKRRQHDGEDPIALPPDDVLIARLREISAQVVTEGEDFLRDPKGK